MSLSIAEHVLSCFDIFKSISAIVIDSAQDNSENARRKIADERSRFKVWSGNIGAHKRGKSSLDYRLRDASHLSSQVKNLLADMKTLLERSCSILDGTRIPWDQDTLDNAEEDGDDISGPEDDDIDFQSELEQISADVAEVINCLMTLSVSMRNPAPHDRLRGSAQTNTSFYEQADISHVRAKYGDADPRLIEILGKANSRRRQYFKYRQSHHQKMSQGLELDLDLGKSVSELQSTVASSIPSALKTKPLGYTGAVNTDELSDSGFTQTSYTPSTENFSKPRFPVLPAESANGPFQCPLCFMMITATTSFSWRKHVFADLRPYSCVAVTCPIAGTEFARRHQWMEHMIQHHWRDWYCMFCDHESFSSAATFQDHLKSEHAEAIPEDDVKAVIDLCERPRGFERATKCPMCHCALNTVREYRHHVGRHLEDVALFVLPQVSEEAKLSDEETNERDIGENLSQVDIYCHEREVLENPRVEDGYEAEAGSNDEMEQLGPEISDVPDTAQAPAATNNNIVDQSKSNLISDTPDGRNIQETDNSWINPNILRHSESPHPIDLNPTSPSGNITADVSLRDRLRGLEARLGYELEMSVNNPSENDESNSISAMSSSSQSGNSDVEIEDLHRSYQLGPGIGDTYLVSNSRSTPRMLEAQVPGSPSGIRSPRQILMERIAREVCQQERERLQHDNSDEETHTIEEVDSRGAKHRVIAAAGAATATTPSTLATVAGSSPSVIRGPRSIMQEGMAREARQPLSLEPVPALSNHLSSKEGMVDEEPYIIKCICDFAEDDGNTIYCDTCDTWQHIKCYYPNNIQDAYKEDLSHYCVDCKPRQLDCQAAIVQQKKLEREHAGEEARKIDEANCRDAVPKPTAAATAANAGEKTAGSTPPGVDPGSNDAVQGVINNEEMTRAATG